MSAFNSHFNNMISYLIDTFVIDQIAKSFLYSNAYGCYVLLSGTEPWAGVAAFELVETSYEYLSHANKARDSHRANYQIICCY